MKFKYKEIELYALLYLLFCKWRSLMGTSAAVIAAPFNKPVSLLSTS